MSLATPIKVLLIVASNGYQPEEYGHTRKELENAGILVTIASNAPGTASVIPTTSNPHYNTQRHNATRVPAFASCRVDLTIDQIDPLAYDAIALVGGAGALECLDNPAMHNIIKRAYNSHKIVGAICISPRILAHAGILAGKQATGWDGDNQLESVFAHHHVTYSKQPVVTDEIIVTANGPKAATAFGQALVNALTNK